MDARIYGERFCCFAHVASLLFYVHVSITTIFRWQYGMIGYVWLVEVRTIPFNRELFLPSELADCFHRAVVVFVFDVFAVRRPVESAATFESLSNVPVCAVVV